MMTSQSETPEEPSPDLATRKTIRSRFVQLLRDVAFIAAVIAIYLVLTIFVLPRFGFQT